jgi:PIN domain nuclease of toxin-antitoxin system
MKALLDTHVFLWWIMDDPQLTTYIRKIISDSDNDLFFSAASCWEIAIKAQLGKLKLPAKSDIFISDQLATNAIQSLPVHSSHALHVFNLPSLHRDPFDRIIVAQAHLENIPVITSDSLISQYDIATIWR